MAAEVPIRTAYDCAKTSALHEPTSIWHFAIDNFLRGLPIAQGPHGVCEIATHPVNVRAAIT